MWNNNNNNNNTYGKSASTYRQPTKTHKHPTTNLEDIWKSMNINDCWRVAILKSQSTCKHIQTQTWTVIYNYLRFCICVFCLDDMIYNQYTCKEQQHWRRTATTHRKSANAYEKSTNTNWKANRPLMQYQTTYWWNTSANTNVKPTTRRYNISTYLWMATKN